MYVKHFLNFKVWTALLICIIITMLLSLVNWLYCDSKIVHKSLRNEVSMVDLHWLFLYGLLVSKGGQSIYTALTVYKTMYLKTQILTTLLL